MVHVTWLKTGFCAYLESKNPVDYNSSMLISTKYAVIFTQREFKPCLKVVNIYMETVYFLSRCLTAVVLKLCFVERTTANGRPSSPHWLDMKFITNGHVSCLSLQIHTHTHTLALGLKPNWCIFYIFTVFPVIKTQHLKVECVVIGF